MSSANSTPQTPSRSSTSPASDIDSNATISGPAEAIDRILGRAGFGAVQIRVAFLCAIVAMLDGFDTQSIAFVAPTLSEAWAIPPERFGFIFSAGLVGIMVGQIGLGPLSDRFGRRPVIIWCAVIFGLGSLATAFAPNWIILLILRFVTGIGLGGATPNVIALTSEYAPPKLRSTVITSMFAGFPLGAAAGAYISSHLIPNYGWQSVFIFGGIVPLLLLPVLYKWLRESPHFLASRSDKSNDLRELLTLISRREISDDELPKRGVGPAQSTSEVRGSFAALFSEGRATMTLALWFAYFNSLLLIYFLFSWIPTMAREAGLPLDTAIASAVALNLGGAIGGVFLGRLSDRWGAFKVLAVGYLIAGIGIAMIGQFANEATTLMALVFISGLFTVGGQTCMNAAATTLYPAANFATGLGAALAVGRIGSIFGPIMGGFLLASNWPLTAIFVVAAVPAILASAVALALVNLIPKKN